MTPDANSASGYADGIVSTTFTVSVMEGRFWSDDGDHDFEWISEKISDDPEAYLIEDVSGNMYELGATVTYIGTATVAGGISTFRSLATSQAFPV